MINVVAQFKTILANGISKTSTGGVLDSNSSSDNDGATLPNGQYGIVIDERNSSREYAIIELDGFNFTFVKRGLSVIDGSTEKDSNKFDHRKGAEVKIVSHPILPLMTKAFNGLEPFGGVPLLPADRTFSNPRHVIDKEYADAIASAGILAMLVAPGTGLHVMINSGTYLLNGVVKSFAAVSDVAVTANETNYVQIKDGDVLVNTTGFEDDVIPLAIVTTNATVVTAVEDKRPFYTGVDVLPDNGLGRSINGIFIKLSPTSCLEFSETEGQEGSLEVKIRTGGGIFKTTDGLEIDGLSTLPVFEALSANELVKSKNDAGTYKAAKIVGLKTAVAQSITKEGDLVKVAELDATTLLILTTTKLYKATWESATGTITNLVDIAPTNLPSTFAILDNQTVVLARLAASSTDNYSMYTQMMTVISGTVTLGAEQSIVVYTTGTTSWKEAYDLVLEKLTPTSVVATLFARNTYSSGNGAEIRATSFSVSGLFVVFGNVYTIGYLGSSIYGNNRYKRSTRVSDTIFAVVYGQDTIDSSSRPTPEAKQLIVCSLAAGVITTNSSTVQSNGSLNTNGSLTIHEYGSALYMFMTKGTTTEVYYSTLSGIVPTTVLATTLTSAISISSSFLFENSVCIISGTSIYSFRVGNGQVKNVPDDSLVDSNLNKVLVSANFCYSFSNDNSIKTAKFLLDRDLLIGIADKAYTTTDDFVIQSIYKKVAGGLIPGCYYYIGADGQSLSTTVTLKKLGRALSPTVIIKE